MLDVHEIGEEALPRLIGVRSVAAPSDPISAAGWVDWRGQADAMAWFVAMRDGADVGAGFALVGWHSDPGIATVEAWTVPSGRGAGTGTAMLDALLAWAADRGSVGADSHVAEDDPDSLAWAGRRGFRETGRSSLRVLDLRSTPERPIAPPEGIEIAPWAERPGIERELYDVFCEAAPDEPGAEAAEIPPFAEWLTSDMSGSSDRRDAVFVALAGDAVVGYAKLSIDDDTGRIAWHDLSAVRRAWRGRGIAGALKRAQIAWARGQGFERLQTQNEQRNTPIVRLNEQLGYVVAPGRIRLRRLF